MMKILDYLFYCCYLFNTKKNNRKAFISDEDAARNFIRYILGISSAMFLIILMVLLARVNIRFSFLGNAIIVSGVIFLLFKLVMPKYNDERIEMLQAKYSGKVSFKKAAVVSIGCVVSALVIAVILIKYLVPMHFRAIH